MDEGCAGVVFTVIASVCANELPQPLLAVTVMLPAVVLAVVVILFVVDVPLQPPGKVQVYDVAPLTALTLYVLVLPEQTVELPEMDAGLAGIALTVTDND